VRLGTPVTDLVRSKNGWRVNGEEFERVVTTLPLTDLPRIAREMPGSAAEAMRGLEFNSITCILIALDRAEHPDLSWIYLPHDSQGPANRVTYMSNYSPELAPRGKTSFLCEVTAGLLRREEVLFTDRTTTRHAYVVFDHEYDARRAASLSWLESADLIPLGRFGRFEYDNSDQCVIKARSLAADLLRQSARG
jgi:protoporphyrinogen oxidase